MSVATGRARVIDLVVVLVIVVIVVVVVALLVLVLVIFLILGAPLLLAFDLFLEDFQKLVVKGVGLRDDLQELLHDERVLLDPHLELSALCLKAAVAVGNVRHDLGLVALALLQLAGQHLVLRLKVREENELLDKHKETELSGLELDVQDQPLLPKLSDPAIHLGDVGGYPVDDALPLVPKLLLDLAHLIELNLGQGAHVLDLGKLPVALVVVAGLEDGQGLGKLDGLL
mmetsp:Transcript_25300/g.52576  ORF Transcript_25300/g.52576 Transcript_25300/m.52576 type:complete len:229 (+) Transcript_25300:1076-1762(+)